MRKTILLFTLLLVMVVSAQAQVPYLKMQDINNPDKLSSQIVNAMSQDSLGFIWIGTIKDSTDTTAMKLKPTKKWQVTAQALPVTR